MNKDIDFDLSCDNWDPLWNLQNAQPKDRQKMIDLHRVKLSRSIKLSSGKTNEVYKVWGDLYTSIHDYPRSCIKLRKALAMEPNSVGVIELFGQSLNALGKPEEAFIHFQKALQLAPGCLFIHQDVLETLKILNRFQDYKLFYGEFLNLYPINKESPDFYYSKAEALVKFKEYPEAFASYRKAIDGFPNPSYIHSRYARALYLGSCFAESLNEYQRVTAFDQTDRDAWNNIAFLMYHLCQTQEAIEFLEDLFQKNMENFTTIPNMIIFQYHLHQNEEALQPYLEKFQSQVNYAFDKTAYTNDLELTELMREETTDENMQDFYLKKIESIKIMLSLADKLKSSE